MSSKSKKQMKFIYAMRKKYGSKKNAPQDKKWVFDSEWTSGVDMDKLPTRVLGFKSFTESLETSDGPNRNFLKSIYKPLINWKLIEDLKDMSLEYIDDYFILNVLIRYNNPIVAQASYSNFPCRGANQAIVLVEFDHSDFNIKWIDNETLRNMIEHDNIVDVEKNIQYVIKLSDSSGFNDIVSTELIGRLKEAYPEEIIK